MHRFVLGTAGHVDHGKTTLVHALTGINTDRLPEEQARGISIELGYAPLPLAPEVMACIVDVPGHEKFLRTMISGATGIQALLLVVAADEGIRPQTREHLEICRLLGVRETVCALTKSDLVSKERLDEETENLETLFLNTPFEGTKIVRVSATDKRGLKELQEELLRIFYRLPRAESRPLLFPIDRLFSLQGHGIVVTGTLSGGTMSIGDRLLVLPEQTEVSVRSLQVFGESCDSVEPGTRLAINLLGIKKEKLKRGQTLCRPNEVPLLSNLHVELEWSSGLDVSRAKKFLHRLRFLTGTQEIDCRLIAKLENSLPSSGNIRLNLPTAVRVLDRFILRTESPPMTFAGGTILGPSVKKERLKKIQIPKSLPILSADHPCIQRIVTSGLTPPTISELATELQETPEIIRATLAMGTKTGNVVRVSDELYCAPSVVREASNQLKAHFARQPTLTLAEWKALIKISRKFAVPLLEHFDRERRTLCRPDRTRVAGPNLNR